MFRYLGRYAHRVAISNSRLVSMDDSAIVFRTHANDTTTLSSTELIGGILQHILPSRFVKIRHFGSQSSRNFNSSLEHALAPSHIDSVGRKPHAAHSQRDEVVLRIRPATRRR